MFCASCTHHIDVKLPEVSTDLVVGGVEALASFWAEAHLQNYLIDSWVASYFR